MRESKFKLWNKKLNRWMDSQDEYVVSIDWNYPDGIIRLSEGSSKRPEIYKWKNLILLEFTGLHDKNGKEIYEGDICKAFSFICEILPINPYEGVQIRWNKDDARAKLIGTRTESIFRNHCTSFEIISNIHENPELLTRQP